MSVATTVENDCGVMMSDKWTFTSQVAAIGQFRRYGTENECATYTNQVVRQRENLGIGLVTANRIVNISSETVRATLCADNGNSKTPKTTSTGLVRSRNE